MNLSIEGAHTFSLREKVAAKRPDEGLRSQLVTALFAAPRRGVLSQQRLKPLTRRLRRPPLLMGEGWTRSAIIAPPSRSEVVAFQGTPSTLSAAVSSAASNPTSSCVTATPHPPPPAAPSPNGRGFARPRVGVPFQQERLQSLSRRPRSLEAGEWGSRRLRSSDIGRPTYFLDNPIKPFLHFVVGEAKLVEAMPLDQVPACLISFNLIEMLFAVHFDRQSEIMTTKVSDKSGDRHLSAKFQSIEPAVAKLLPKNIFGRRAPGTQTSCNRDQSFSHPIQIARRNRRPQPLTRTSGGTLSHWERVGLAAR
jgi:hypothetical protein